MTILSVIAIDNDSISSCTPSGKTIIKKKLNGLVKPDEIVSVILRTYVYVDFRKPKFTVPKKILYLQNKSKTASPATFELTEMLLKQASEVELIKSTNGKNNLESITSDEWDELVKIEEEVFPETDSLQCIVCKKPLLKESFRCSECKAVVYCSRNCQKKDWKNAHKIQCKSYKEIMENNSKLYDLSFSYFNPRTQLKFVGCRDLLLLERDVLETGLFNCYQYIQDPNVKEGQFGEVGLKLYEECKNKTPNEKATAYGIPECWEMFKPQSLPLPNSWKELYDRFNISNKSVCSLILSNIFTLANIINSQLSLSNNEKKLVHLIGCDIEADLIPLYEILLNMYPKNTLNIEIHMYGPLISKKYNSKKIKISSNENIINVCTISSVYDSKYLKEEPDILICLNPAFFLDPLWKNTTSILLEDKPKNLKLVVSERDGNSVNALEKYCEFKNLKINRITEINPFREPYVEYIMGMIIPCIRNSYICVIQ